MTVEFSMGTFPRVIDAHAVVGGGYATFLKSDGFKSARRIDKTYITDHVIWPAPLPLTHSMSATEFTLFALKWG